MKVLVFTSQFAVGAAERLGAELAVDLNRIGIHADVMGMYTADRDGSVVAREDLLRRGVPEVHYLGMSPNPSPDQLVAGMARLNMFLRRNGYDIVETSSLTPGILAAWGRLGTRARHVVGLHYAFSDSAAAPRSIGLFRWTMRLRKDSRFYAVSSYVKDAWTAYSGIPAERTRVIYNCISPKAGEPGEVRRRVRGELGLPEDKAVLLCAGRIAAYKRQEVVVDALRMDGYPRDMVVLFAGDVDFDIEGTREMMARMDGTIARYGLAGKVRFLGHREDIGDLMASSDLLVHATEKEAFGMVLVEALASGLPVVSTDVEGIPEVLEGTDSILVKPGDAAALRRGLDAALARDAATVQRVRKKGLERARRFVQAERTSRMIAFFDDVVAGRA